MAFGISQDFDDLTDGDLTGQGGGSGWSGNWSGDVAFDVTGAATPQAGAKHISVVNNADVDKTIDRSLTTAVKTGRLDIYGRIDLDVPTTVRWRIELFKGATEMTEIFFYPSQLEQLYWNGTSNVRQIIASGLTNDTYYKISMELDDVAQSGKYRVAVNDSFGSWQQFVGGATIEAGIDKVRLAHGGNNGLGTGTVYFDSISSPADAAVAVVSPTLLTLGVG